MPNSSNTTENASKWELWKQKCETTWEASPAVFWSLRRLIDDQYIPARDKMLWSICFSHAAVVDPDRHNDGVNFPLIHRYGDCAATAVNDDENRGLLLDLALRAIRCFPAGDSFVYLMDSDITGDFNRIERIFPTSGYVHYVTRENDIDGLLHDLAEQIEQNRRIINVEVADVMTHNRMFPAAFIPPRYVFIRDIASALNSRQIGLLMNLIQNNSASKAGIYVFFSHSGQSLMHNNPLKKLIGMSSSLELAPTSVSKEKPMPIEPPTVQDVRDIGAWLGLQARSTGKVSLQDWIKTSLQSNRPWNTVIGTPNHLLSIPVGFKPDNTIQEIEFRFSGGCPHSYVAGKSGCGKTILLHNLIINGAVKYSPDQLQFYLLDMKGAGVSFNYYRNLPHVAALSMENDREFAISVLQKLSDENQRRAVLFASQKVTKLDDYNDVARSKRLPTMPYIMCIVDEYQELFPRHDNKASETTKLLQQILKQGRSQGIILILCTQKPETEGMGDPSNIANRIALHLDLPLDSKILLGNSSATKLTNAGDAILKTASIAEQSPKFNQPFHVANIDERDELPRYVERLSEIHLACNRGVDPLTHLVFDGAKISKNPSWLDGGTRQQIFLGAPRYCRVEHIGIRLHRNSKSNVLIVGNDRYSALRLVGLIGYQFVHLYDKGQVIITDLQNDEEPTCRALSFLTGGPYDIRLSSRETLSERINALYEEVMLRTTDTGSYPETLFAIIDYKHQQFDKDMLKKLKTLICDGPNVGIHTLVYGYNSNNLSSLLHEITRPLLTQFEIKIGLLGGEPAKSFSDTYTSTELVDKAGCAQIAAPRTMMGEKKESKFGYPFQIYNEPGDFERTDDTLASVFSELQSLDHEIN